MPCVVGIDLSSRAIDLVRLDENQDRAAWQRVELAGETAFQRIRQIQTGMPAASWWDDVYLAAVERPFSRSRNDVVRLAEGAVLACVPSSVELWEVAPQTWKKALGIAAQTKPTYARFHGFSLSPWGSWTQDALDALGVALYARDLNAAGVDAALVSVREAVE